jgi:tRNA C32,U32 (ribose-2'-O)-methylase TrmJ
LLEALQASGYVKDSGRHARSRSGASVEEKVRRFTRRMNLSAADAELLLGMLRQILWKIQA